MVNENVTSRDSFNFKTIETALNSNAAPFSPSTSHQAQLRLCKSPRAPACHKRAVIPISTEKPLLHFYYVRN